MITIRKLSRFASEWEAKRVRLCLCWRVKGKPTPLFPLEPLKPFISAADCRFSSVCFLQLLHFIALNVGSVKKKKKKVIADLQNCGIDNDIKDLMRSQFHVRADTSSLSLCHPSITVVSLVHCCIKIPPLLKIRFILDVCKALHPLRWGFPHSFS